MRILAAADIHGNFEAYRWLVELARPPEVEALVLAGDLLLGDEDCGEIEEAQRREVPRVLEVLNRAAVPVLFVMGNDDFVELQPLPPGVHGIHGRRQQLGDYGFVGYRYTLPFIGGPFEKTEDEIAADMMELLPLLDGRTVLVTHCPAYGLLDLGILDRHAGSPAIRRAVEASGVRAHIHGHTHRCFGREGRHFNVAAGARSRAMRIDLETLEYQPLGELPSLPPEHIGSKHETHSGGVHVAPTQAQGGTS